MHTCITGAGSDLSAELRKGNESADYSDDAGDGTEAAAEEGDVVGYVGVRSVPGEARVAEQVDGGQDHLVEGASGHI